MNVARKFKLSELSAISIKAKTISLFWDTVKENLKQNVSFRGAKN
jgi:hypothetical protein